MNGELTEFSVEVLSPLEVLDQSQSVRLLIVPHAWESWAVSKGTNGVFPVPVGLVVVTLEHVTAREADHRWSKFQQSFSKINA